MFRKFLNFNFGEVSVVDVIKGIFVIGLIPIIIYSAIIPFVANMRNISLFSKITLLNTVFIPNILVLLFISLFFLLISTVIWKLICEMLYLIFKSLEVFIKKNEWNVISCFEYLICLHLYFNFCIYYFCINIFIWRKHYERE